PNGTATPRSTATPNSSATPTTQAVRELPARVDSFNRVEQETNDGVRVGVYRSADLNALVEVRLAQGTTARELITQLGGTNTTQVGDATCSSVGDTICAQERNNVTVAVSTKQLPASVVAGLTTKVLDGN
ncbi:MAG: hypothetical protein Q4G46_10460, partial [Propionibacteriaceae bacterium]|nr:hypothetical protein [Propionibacteriaceae bacterium]